MEHENVSFDLSPDGKTLVFSSADGDLYLFELATKHVTRLTRTTRTESSPAFSPDGKSVTFTAEPAPGKGGAVFVLQLADQKVRQVTRSANRSDAQPRFSADGKLITFAAAHRRRPYSMGGWTWDQYDIYLVRSDGSNLRRLTRGSYYQATRPNVTSDGKYVIFAADVPVSRDPTAGVVTELLEVKASGKDEARSIAPPPNRNKRYGAWATDCTL